MRQPQQPRLDRPASWLYSFEIEKNLNCAPALRGRQLAVPRVRGRQKNPGGNGHASD